MKQFVEVQVLSWAHMFMTLSSEEKPTNLEYKSYCMYCGEYVHTKSVLPDFYPEHGRMNDSICEKCKREKLQSVKM